MDVDKRYKVTGPEQDRGELGTCVAVKKSDFGHVWGTVKLDNGKKVTLRSSDFEEVTHGT